MLLETLAWAQSRVLYVPGSSQRICQLLGETDIQFKTPTLNQTETNFGLRGADLGASFEYQGAAWFLFGDSFAVGGQQPDAYDSDAHSTDTNADGCIHLQFTTEPHNVKLYRPPVVSGYPNGVTPIGHTGFKIPVHGFSGGSCPSQSPKMYVFFGSLDPVGPRRLILTYSCDAAQTFQYVTDVSTDKFINVSAEIVNNADWPGLPSASGQGLLVFASGQYRASAPYLAWVPLGSVEDMKTWQYFAGLDTNGAPIWCANNETAARSIFRTVPNTAGCTALSGSEPLLPNFSDTAQGNGPCIGELSVTWNPFLQKWLLLYNCGGTPHGIRFQYADKPWGPWSDITATPPDRSLVFDAVADHGYGVFMHANRESSHACTAAGDCPAGTPGELVGCAPANAAPHATVCQYAANDNLWDAMFGSPRIFANAGTYGPYVISRFTKGDSRSSTIYYTMSTWNPYEPMLVKSTLRLERPPVADAGMYATFHAGADGTAQVPLDGTGSTDPDGDPLTYTWTGPFGTLTGAKPTATLPLGTSSVTLTVDDGLGDTSTATVQITVTTPAIVTVSPTSPPNSPPPTVTPTRTAERTVTSTARASTATTGPSATPTSTPLAGLACVGDCNHDGTVTVDEILTTAQIALGDRPLTACAAGDANHDGWITVDEILAAVKAAVNGCAARQSIVSISVCTPGSGSGGSCPSGGVDSLQPVLAPLAQGGSVINAYGGLFGLSDEHSTILPPGTLPGHANDYLILGASQTTLAAGGGPGLVVLTGSAGPDANGQWTLDFAPEYGRYQPANPAGSQNGQVFTASMGIGNCPTVVDATLEDPTFDLSYAAPGSVVIDPTNPTNSGPGNLIMVYEGTNKCIGVTGPATAGNFYSTIGIATSLDHGVTWPTYRSSWVPLPAQNTTQGPNAPAGALGNETCMGNDCVSTPPTKYGRYAVVSQPVTVAAAMQSAQSFNHDMGNSELSAFVDDVNVAGGIYLYIVSKYGTGPTDLGGFHFGPSALTGGIAVARAALNGGSAPLKFMKWYGPAVSYATGTASGSFAQRIPPVLPPGVTCSTSTCPPFPDNRGLGSDGGGLESPLFPVDPNGDANSPSYKTCQAASQGQSMPAINYVEDTREYLLTFVCVSPTDPATGAGPAGAAWFYSTLDATQYDLSRQDKWSAPREIVGSWSPYDSTNQCGSSDFRYYRGWYPSFMSMGRKPGHLATSGYVFFLSGCTGGGAGRQFSTRTFTITSN